MSILNSDIYQAGSNENLFGISPKVQEALQTALTGIYSYPYPDAAPLRAAIAEKLGIRTEEIVVGSGSAELISLLVRACCQPFHQSTVLSVSPTYPLYRMESEALGVTYKAIPLNSAFDLEVDYLLTEVDASTRICFISNPNNPTGTYLNKAQLEQLIRELPAHVTLVIDEAYIEYVTAPDFADALAYRHLRDNLVVLRTFSKAYGLASLRVGYMIAQEKTLQRVLQIKQPFNVNQLAQVAAYAAIQDDDFLHYTLQATSIGKKHLQQELDRIGVQHWPSEGNFLMIDAGLPAQQVYQHLLQNNIQVRQTENTFALRVTVGKKEHQDRLINVLQKLLNPVSLMNHPKLAQIVETGQTLLMDRQPENLAAVTENLLKQGVAGGDAADRITLAFARAFSARVSQGTKHAGNLYSSTFDVIDMISAFNVLVKETPLVTFGHVFANLSIANAVAEEQQIHIIDLGIGGGMQWLHLLDLLATRQTALPEVRITGIDIPAPGDDPEQKLKITGNMLQQHAAKLGIALQYHAVASKLEDLNLLELDLTPGEAIVVNAALMLHHIPDQLVTQQNERDRVLLQVKALHPKIFTLTEPDSEHNKLDFMPRLRESLRHYYTVFDVLDTLLPKQMPERLVMEQEFFGREIINVISCEGSARVERHERSEAWLSRLNKIGFTPVIQDSLDETIADTLELHQNFELLPIPAGYLMRWKGTPVIASTAWH